MVVWIHDIRNHKELTVNQIINVIFMIKSLLSKSFVRLSIYNFFWICKFNIYNDCKLFTRRICSLEPMSLNWIIGLKLDDQFLFVRDDVARDVTNAPAIFPQELARGGKQLNVIVNALVVGLYRKLVEGQLDAMPRRSCYPPFAVWFARIIFWPQRTDYYAFVIV